MNPKDISKIDAYDESGNYIGLLEARGEYGTTSHSLKTRKLAEELARERKISKTNPFYKPISQFEDHLDEQAKSSRRAATRRNIVRREQEPAGTPTVPEKQNTTQKAVPDDIVPIYGKSIKRMAKCQPQKT